jgi:hypothetical protein
MLILVVCTWDTSDTSNIDDTVIGRQRIFKGNTNFKKADVVLLKISQHLLGRTVDSHKMREAVYLVSRSAFEGRTFRTQARSVAVSTHLLATLSSNMTKKKR